MRIEKKGDWWVDGRGNLLSQSREWAIKKMFELAVVENYYRTRKALPGRVQSCMPSRGMNEFDPVIGDWRD